MSWTPMKVRTKVLTGYFVVLGVMTVVSAAVYQSIDDLVDDANWVEHTRHRWCFAYGVCCEDA